MSIAYEKYRLIAVARKSRGVVHPSEVNHARKLWHENQDERMHPIKN